MNNLRVIYMGTSDFSIAPFEGLIEEKYNIVAVITAPDKPSGRYLKMKESPMKKRAMQYGLPILQPANLKSSEFITKLVSFQADLQIVVAFRMLPQIVWSMPSIGTFNLHASLLPRYRGAAPIHWAIINGEKETGVTTFFLKQKIDTGDILLQEKESIFFEDTVGTLYERLKEKGASLVLKTVKLIESGNYTLKEQDLKKSFPKAPKILKNNCRIDFSKSTQQVYNFVRGLSPFPGAWTIMKGKEHKIFFVKPNFKTHMLDDRQIYFSDNQSFLYFKTGDGSVGIEEIQQEGKKRMFIKDFLRGKKYN